MKCTKCGCTEPKEFYHYKKTVCKACMRKYSEEYRIKHKKTDQDNNSVEPWDDKKIREWNLQHPFKADYVHRVRQQSILSA